MAPGQLPTDQVQGAPAPYCENISFSASRAIWLIVATASTGNWPIALSPESMTASVPSSTALNTSLASARVGRLDDSMLLSIWVAVITGTRARWQASMICFWTAGTFETSISTPRSPRATITASASAMMASRLATAWGFSIFATIRARLCLRSSSARSRVMSATWRTNDSPTYSTAVLGRPVQVLEVLLRQGLDAERRAGDVDPLVGPDPAGQRDLHLGPARAVAR